MTNKELLNKMEEEISLRGLSPWTRQEYLCRAKAFLHHFAPKLLADVTDLELRDYLLFIRTETSYYAGTANLFNSTMRFIFGACDDGSKTGLHDKSILMTMYGSGLNRLEKKIKPANES